MLLVGLEKKPSHTYDFAKTFYNRIIKGMSGKREGQGQVSIFGRSYDKGNEIVPGLWVSDLDTALNENFIEKNRIMTVINATEFAPFVTNHDPAMKQFRVPIADARDENDILYGYLPMAVAMIDSGLRRGENVLVHCHQGISRSCSIVAAYLWVQNCDKTFDEIAEYIKSKRGQAFKWGAHFKPAIQKFKEVYC